MATITVTIPANTTTDRSFGHEASVATRVPAGTPGAVKLPLWLRRGDRVPRVGETVGTYRDGSTLYVMGVRG